MKKLPKILATCAIRAAAYKDPHGGLYHVDLESGEYKLVVNWSPKIDLNGRGAERGLRGIAVYKDCVIAAAASNIVFFDKKFNVQRIEVNKYLKYCHEIFVRDDVLYILPTGFNCLILYDLINNKFINSFLIGSNEVLSFDPNSDIKDKLMDYQHLNSVFVDSDKNIFVSGVNTSALHVIKGDKLLKHSQIPSGTHNAQPCGKNQIMLNNTQKSRIQLFQNGGKLLKSANVDKLAKKKGVSDKIARQPFARGLCLTKELVIGGSSPAMITVYDRDSFKKIKSIIMSDDIRFSIHGITLWED